MYPPRRLRARAGGHLGQRAHRAQRRRAAQPVRLEAEPALDREEEQPDIFAAPLAAESAPIEPAIVQPITRIVDPAAAEAGDEQDEPLFAEPAYEERRPRGGFLSIFGSRPRYDAPQPAPQAAQRARSSHRPCTRHPHAPRTHVRVSLRDVARYREHQPHGEVGHVVSQHIRRMGHRKTACNSARRSFKANVSVRRWTSQRLKKRARKRRKRQTYAKKMWTFN